nr:hypothetical protein [Tanacetum cinerariifolium]
MGSLENKTEKMPTPILTTSRSPRKNLSSDKNIAQELMDTVSLLTATTSKDPHQKRCIFRKYSHLPGAFRRMCRRQGYMIRDMERKSTNDLIEDNLKRVVADTIIQERDAFQAKYSTWLNKSFQLLNLSSDFKELREATIMLCSKKKDVIKYPRFTKIIIVDLMKKYPYISLRFKEDYHSIKDDIPLYDTVFVNVAVLMNQLKVVVDDENKEEMKD